MKRYVEIFSVHMLILRVFIVFVVFFYCPSTVMAAESFTVELAGNKLSVSATDVPLRAILLKLANQGVTVKIDPQVNPSVTAHFLQRPIEKAIDSIVKPASYSLLWKGAADRSGGDESYVVSEIQVFQDGRQGSIQPLGKGKSNKIVQNQDGVLYVANEILLQIPAGMDIRDLEKVLKRYGGTLDFDSLLPGIVKIILPDGSDVFAIVEEIKNTLDLDLVEPNYAYPLNVPVRYTNTVPQSPIQTDTPSVTADTPSVAILDSGVDEIAGLDQVVLASLNAVDPNAQATDTLGHGTQMALIASGLIEPHGTAGNMEQVVPVIPIKAFDDNGYATSISIMSSIDFALQNNSPVMSLSWGTEVDSIFMENAFKYADSKGIVVVASAGNEPTGTPVYPAAYPSVIGVGALQPDGKRWSKSNYGDFVTLYAPGFALMPVGYNGDPGMYGGTSISTALVANSTANYLKKYPGASRQNIIRYLENRYK